MIITITHTRINFKKVKFEKNPLRRCDDENLTTARMLSKLLNLVIKIITEQIILKTTILKTKTRSS